MSKKITIAVITMVVIISAYLTLSHQIKRGEEKHIEEIILNYLSLIQTKRFNEVSEITFFKDENIWILEELSWVWEPFEIIDKGTIQLKEVENGLYSSAVDVRVFIESEGIYDTIIVDPYVAYIDDEWKLIINPRDIPSNFSYDAELPDGIINLDEIELLD
jgi:hypothetical protein